MFQGEIFPVSLAKITQSFRPTFCARSIQEILGAVVEAVAMEIAIKMAAAGGKKPTIMAGREETIMLDRKRVHPQMAIAEAEMRPEEIATTLIFSLRSPRERSPVKLAKITRWLALRPFEKGQVSRTLSLPLTI